MNHYYGLSKSSTGVTLFARIFLWIVLSIAGCLFTESVFALITGQAVWYRVAIVFVGITLGLWPGVLIPFQIINQYNRIRVVEEGLYVDVYVFRYVWKFVPWDEVIDLRLLPVLDRWRKPQWLLRVKHLTYWHRWISWYYRCGSDPGIVINSDLINGDQLLDILNEKISGQTAEVSE